MVRTRGNLSRRGSNDVPESSTQGGARKRPTASARIRGQHEANVVEDDIVENEVSDVPQEDKQGIDNDGGGFPGGPYDTSLLTRYEDHVARMIWDGQVKRIVEAVSHTAETEPGIRFRCVFWFSTMVRTRGNLSRRGSNDVPESSTQGGARKRPTASARIRGQHEANVVEDDIVENEVSDVPQEDKQGIDNDGGGFPGGPYDTSLLTRYEDHVARMIWDGQMT
ncbi:hypothetical protein DEO72_LG4g121 [Vigna unguiculata]|uniref:Uncharacterized protein n=1 Tax=Vigna unguiculata TaxID=3917 RepID=A0A4D6LKD6_VIGUN|nr:hypothetical protein DEO72_LG4g121 [Vigna unguiculata]